jgi:muramoyltetrapeptide carboxypeptidase
LKRRNFIKTTSAASLATLISPKIIADGRQYSGNNLIKPRALKRGDRIALVTPGSYITNDEQQESINNLQTLGFEVVYSERLMQKNGYFSANDEERAADINEMFSREDIAGIVCARGGYGCTRILPYLDYNLINKNPKPLIGFSDVTALLYALYKYSSLITYHGPVAISTFSNFSKNYFNRVLIEPEDEFELENSRNGNNYNIYGITSVADGVGEGELIGGNLSIVASLIGTPYDVDTTAKIIFLEEFLEEPYRIDRMLTQMLQAGKFEKAAGVALGVFKMCESNRQNPSFSGSFSLMDVLNDRLGNLGIPVIYGLSFGHVIDKLTLPVGIKAEINSKRKTLKLLEKPVV